MGDRVLWPGRARGVVLRLAEPLSLWGGYDPETGTVVDAHHPQRGAEAAGRVLVMPSGRGSSSGSSVLAEAIRRGSAPAAIVLAESDPIIVVGAVVGHMLYGRTVPIVVADSHRYAELVSGRQVAVTERGVEL